MRDTQDPDNEVDRFRILYPNGDCEWIEANGHIYFDQQEFRRSCYIDPDRFDADPFVNLEDTLRRMQKFDEPERNCDYCLKIIEVIPL